MLHLWLAHSEETLSVIGFICDVGMEFLERILLAVDAI